MKCPYCTTENREDRESCYHCGKDISILRLIINKARHHYNVALEHAERQRYSESLGELEHCLELDYSFAPAHVVMGSVYAKMGKFDAAERCWQTALSLDPHILKAHDYVSKSALAKKGIPLVRRLRWAIGLTLGIAAVLVLVILWQLRPTSDKADLKQIAAEITKSNYAAALKLARHLKDTGRTLDVRHAAGLLERTLEQRYESAAMEMLTFLLENKPVEAHQLCQQLVQKQTLPDRYARELESLDQKAAEQALTLVDSWRRQFDEGKLPYDDLAKKAKDLTQAFVQRPNVAQQTTKILASARQSWVARTLAQLPRSTVSTTETLSWLSRLRELSVRVPESRAVLTSATKHLVAECVTQMERGVDKVLAGKDPAPVRSALDALERLNTYQRTESADRLIEKAREGFKRIATARFKSRLSAATTADIPQLDAWVASYEKDTSVTVANDTEVSGVVTRARQRLASQMVEWCNDREVRFARRKITNEEAKFVADRAEFLLKYLAGKSWRNTRDCAIYCAANAWLHLGNTEEALRWFHRLEGSYPESSYIPAARRLRQKIEEDLKIPIPPLVQ